MNTETKKNKLSLQAKKQQVNIKNNSGLHFQIGLIAVLFIVFGVFQLQFEKKPYSKPIAITDMTEETIIHPNYIIEKVKVKPVKKVQVKRQKPSTKYKIVKEIEKIIVKTETEKPVINNTKPILKNKKNNRYT